MSAFHGGVSDVDHGAGAVVIQRQDCGSNGPDDLCLEVARAQFHRNREPLPLVHLLSKKLGDEAQYPIVDEELVEPVEQGRLGLELLVLNLELSQGDDFGHALYALRFEEV